MINKIKKLIEGIGLESKEAAVYLACLELDGGTNSQISKKSGLNRITNYDILKKLERKAVVGSYLRHGVKYFDAIDPRIVLKQAKERVSLAEQALPEILALSNQIEKKPRIQFFEGIDGIKTIYDDSLTAESEILTFTNPKDVRELIGNEYIDNYVAERVKRKIPLRGMAPNDPYGQKEKEAANTLMRQAMLFPEELYKISNEIMIYDDKISIYSGEDKIGLIIKNESLASTFRNIWQMAWDNSKRFND